ncbi:MAG: quinolinate synthase NadA [Ignavibacteriales bacterium]|nr:MAG: quinolinate synthase NadA [Ignavibacteriales bacterium]
MKRELIMFAEEQAFYRNEIVKLKNDLNAVILAHYYQDDDIQDLADYIGDSLELARRAKAAEADVIVFCGVHFMAETAKILNPDRMVIIPSMEAGCSLADSCLPNDFKKFREEHPDHIAVTYINCSAEVKALSDIICTSSNAEKIINEIPVDKPILFSPDKNLGRYLVKKTGRDMLLWNGSCIVHEHFSEKKLLDVVYEHRDAKVIAHPECEDTFLMYANFIGSTSALLKYIQESPADKFIVATEPGIIHQMKKVRPEKIFVEAPMSEGCSCNVCPHMKKNNLENLYLCMKNLSPKIEMNEELRLRALKPIETMLAMS